jgi:hypothetical protein
MRRKTRGRREPSRVRSQPQTDLLFLERAERSDQIVMEVDRPQAFRPRLVGFWLDRQFHLITRVAATRREHDAVYHRVVTDRGAFDLRDVRVMDPGTLRIRRRWELCAELDAMLISRPG